MDASPEYEISNQEVIKREWKIWNDLIENRGITDVRENIRHFEFTIDRRGESESLFTSDRVVALKFNKPLEEWTTTDPEFQETREGEEWIQLTVDPKNPYTPRLGIHTAKGTHYEGGERDFYFTEGLNIFLSNQGRAYEDTWWVNVLDPDIHPNNQHPYYSYLKRYPKSEEIQIKFTDEPEERYTESFRPLKGQNLERLDFIVKQVQSGNIHVPT